MSVNPQQCECESSSEALNGKIKIFPHSLNYAHVGLVRILLKLLTRHNDKKTEL